MPTRVKLYIGAVIAAGVGTAAWSFTQATLFEPKPFILYLVAAVAASLWKLRLPGLEGTYSLNFLFVLVGLLRFSLAETLLVGCAAGLAQSVLLTKKRPTLVQILFNLANLAVSIGLCFWVGRELLGEVAESFPPAALAAAACVYFVVNTLLVSGVLSLLQGKSLSETASEWYVWSFPYYLIGAALVGLLPLTPQGTPPEAWIILLPALYLIHFFYGLTIQGRLAQGSTASESANPLLPISGKLYLGAVIASGLGLLGWGVLEWESAGLVRFATFLAMALLASCCKVRLPGVTETVSLNFVVVLAAIAELSLPEVVFLAAASAVVQSIWKPKVRPQALQVWFGLASMALSSAVAFVGAQAGSQEMFGASVVPFLVVATVLLYGCNVALVSAAISWVEGRPVRGLGMRCYFWTFPYYVVGAAFAGLMMAASRSIEWSTALLVLPLAVLVFLSYRLHVNRVVEPDQRQAPV